MKRKLELNLGVMMLLTCAIGCGGNSSDAGAGGASSGAGRSNSDSGAGGSTAMPGGGSTAMPGGGSTAMPGGGAHSGGQTSTAGSGGAAPGGDFMTSVPGTTPLTDLTPDQQAQLCSDLQKYLEASASDFGCKGLALVTAAQAADDASAQAACKTAVAGCTPDTTGAGMCDANEPATCTATVADLSKCASDTNAALANLNAAVPSCDGLTLAKAQAGLLALAAAGDLNPPSCAKYSAECGSMTGM